MPRVKRGTMTNKRHKKVLESAKGYWGGKSRLFKTAHEQWMKSGNYAYRDRRNKKRAFRALWIVRISAACRAQGMSYSRFIEGLTKAGIDIDRKILASLAVSDPDTFTQLVAQATSALKTAGEPATA
ncbi:MAG TPA: 50S ribosomal protein L20 [Chthonomonadaceae bacterium]|nr:50S ribosomal protein L20 [Chthonomonadaceae bacterium]